MIKGLISLFTSGVIFNPMVLLGVLSGAYSILKLEPEQIRLLFLDARFYIVVAGVSVIYTFLFAKVYQEGGKDIDWMATCSKIMWNAFRYLVAFVLSMSFVVMISIF